MCIDMTEAPIYWLSCNVDEGIYIHSSTPVVEQASLDPLTATLGHHKQMERQLNNHPVLEMLVISISSIHHARTRLLI